MARAVVWLRRDLRTHDHPALCAAHADGDEVLALFVLDPVLLGRCGPARLAWLAGNLGALDDRLQGRLVIALGEPGQVVPRWAQRVRATSVHVTGEVTPYGRRRDARVAAALRDARVEWREH